MKILNKTELIHPIFLFLFISVGVGSFVSLDSISLLEFNGKNFLELLPSILLVLISYFILNALHTSRIVAIKKQNIIKGIYCAPFGFVKIHKRIKLSEVNDIELKQNDKFFYDIIAQSNDDNYIVIKSIANKNPAEEELIHVKNKLKNI